MRSNNKHFKAPSRIHNDSSEDEPQQKVTSSSFYPQQTYIQNPVNQYHDLLQQQQNSVTPNGNRKLSRLFQSPSDNYGSRVSMRTKSKSSLNRSKSNKSGKAPIKSALSKNPIDIKRRMSIQARLIIATKIVS